jgi:hypothetical protein
MFAPKYRPLVHKLLLLALLVLPAGCGLADDYGSVVKLIELFTRVKAAKVDYEICLVRDAKHVRDDLLQVFSNRPKLIGDITSCRANVRGCCNLYSESGILLVFTKNDEIQCVNVYRSQMKEEPKRHICGSSQDLPMLLGNVR